MFNIKKKGLTLIETLIAFTILTFVLTPMMMIINSSVKTNKSGEDKQQTLYIAQKYAEDFKSKGIDKNKLGQIQTFKNKDVPDGNKDLDIPDGYFVNVLVEPLTEYKFSDVATGTATQVASPNPDENTGDTNYNGYDSIQYDGKIVISKDMTNLDIAAHMELDIKDGSQHTYDLKDSYTVEISNGKDDGSNVLIINVKDDHNNNINKEPWVVNKNPSTSKDSNVIIQVDANEKNEPTAKLYINCYNKISESSMCVYLVKSKNTTLSEEYNNDVINSLLTNQQGKVNIYSNIYNKTDTTNAYSNTDTRVYKITIKLFKDGQNTDPQSGDKPISQVVTYKTVQQ
ncbi:type IV pilus modification PilV family protein [Clostridium magnum]|uniref:Uncharacterized protein n=1 Tax=Clostridium magnum DSM 2767 TaxID=1121326 RepID=A0A161YR52_9CLOT|nr:prepilin-type N-terminal cleavage/methylation domain-containing protein [Clostridium magnum]KZL93402.1 hypothetical protein CLMAG_04260 [Clostridium magnum DSM 2767]SHI15828.1 Type II secretory pathway, pseudopilin PulG [Clostridium magnum DSM 2767]